MRMLRWICIGIIGFCTWQHVKAESIFINCGSTSDYNDGTNIWLSDRYFTSGSTFSTTADIDGAIDSTIYQTERWSSSLSYEIPVNEDGPHDVTIYLAEIYTGAFGIGKRVFDVSVGGSMVEGIDIFDATGAGNEALQITMPNVQVNGILTIDFIKRIQNPKCSAIQVVPSGSISTGPTLPATTVTTVSPPPGTSSVFLNCGGPEHSDGVNLWKDDSLSGFIDTGNVYSIATEIQGTVSELEKLYQSERYSSQQMVYDVTGLDDGQYDISLHWSEIYTGAFGIGLRLFDVILVSGETRVLQNIDIYERAGGGYAATVENFNSFEVVGGNVMIAFVKGARQNPKCAAIEIRPSALPPGTTTPPLPTTTVAPPALSKYINCGSVSNYDDLQGNTWESDTDYFFNAGTIFTVDTAIENTEIDPLYQSERYDSSSPSSRMTYSIPLEGTGIQEVLVVIHLAETYFTAANRRVFDILIEGVNEFPGVDPFQLSGNAKNKAATLSKIVTVSDDKLTITFGKKIQNPKICGIEIHQAAGPTSPTLSSSTTTSTTTETTTLSTTEGATSTTETSTTTTTTTLTSSSSQPNEPVWIDLNEDESYSKRHECSFVQAGDKFYLFGGRENSTQLEIYDYASDSWSTGPQAPLPFNHFQAVEYEGLIWVIGSYKTNSFPNEALTEDVYVFDPANAIWLKGPAIPPGRRRGGGGLQVYNGKFYLVGGNTLGHKSGFVSWMDEYDPQTGQWRQLSNAPIARDHFHAAVVGSRLYAAGGRQTAHEQNKTFSEVIPQVDVFDFDTETWLPSGSTPDDLPDPRAAAATTVFKGKVILAGGESGTSTLAYDEVHELNPASGEWKTLASLNHARHGTQAIASGEGVYVAAGSWRQGGGNQHNMEVYNQNAPTGVASDAGALSAPSSVSINVGTPTTVTIQQTSGNQGVFVTAMALGGFNFAITSGDSSRVLIRNGGTLDVVIEYTGTQDNAMGLLLVEYSGDEILLVDLVGKTSQPGPSTAATTTTTTTTTSTSALSDLDIEEFIIVNAENNKNISFVEDWTGYAPSPPFMLSVEVVPRGVVGSVRLTLSGPESAVRIEGVAPFALFGDKSGDFYGRVLPSGNYNVTAQAFSSSGNPGPVRWRTFSV